MLEVIAKCILFARENSAVTVKNAGFVGGVYRVDLDSVELPDKPFVNDIVDEHIICKDLVRSILKRDVSCRDDDMLLLLEVWKSQGVLINLNNIELDIMFSAESITRARRKVQNGEGLFPPTSFTVAKKRRISEELLTEYYGRGDVL